MPIDSTTIKPGMLGSAAGSGEMADYPAFLTRITTETQRTLRRKQLVIANLQFVIGDFRNDQFQMNNYQ
jgi:hypothetical protein